MNNLGGLALNGVAPPVVVGAGDAQNGANGLENFPGHQSDNSDSDSGDEGAENEAAEPAFKVKTLEETCLDAYLVYLEKEAAAFCQLSTLGDESRLLLVRFLRENRP